MRTSSSKPGSGQDRREPAHAEQRQRQPQPRNPVADNQVQHQQITTSAQGYNSSEGGVQGPAKHRQKRKGPAGRGRQGAPGQAVAEGPLASKVVPLHSGEGRQVANGATLPSAEQVNSLRQAARQDLANGHRPPGSNHSAGSHRGRVLHRGHVVAKAIHIRSSGPRRASSGQNRVAVPVGSQNHQDGIVGQEQMAEGSLPTEQAPTRNSSSNLQQGPVRQGPGPATSLPSVGEAPVNSLLRLFAAPRAEGPGHSSGQAEAVGQIPSGQPGRGRVRGKPPAHGAVEQDRISLCDRLRMNTRSSTRSPRSSLPAGLRPTTIKVVIPPPKQSGSREQGGNLSIHEGPDSGHVPSPLGQGSTGEQQGRGARAQPASHREETSVAGPGQAGGRRGGRGQQVLRKDGLERMLPGEKHQSRAGTRPAREGSVALPPKGPGGAQLPQGIDPQHAGRGLSEDGGKTFQEGRPGQARHEVELPLALGQLARMNSITNDLQGTFGGQAPERSPRLPEQRGERPAQGKQNKRERRKAAAVGGDRGTRSAGDQTPPSGRIEGLPLTPHGSVSNTRRPVDERSSPPSAIGLYAGPSHAASSPHPSQLPMPSFLWRDPVPRLEWRDAPDDVAKDPP